MFTSLCVWGVVFCLDLLGPPFYFKSFFPLSVEKPVKFIYSMYMNYDAILRLPGDLLHPHKHTHSFHQSRQGSHILKVAIRERWVGVNQSYTK